MYDKSSLMIYFEKELYKLWPFCITFFCTTIYLKKSCKIRFWTILMVQKNKGNLILCHNESVLTHRYVQNNFFILNFVFILLTLKNRRNLLNGHIKSFELAVIRKTMNYVNSLFPWQDNFRLLIIRLNKYFKLIKK